MSIQNLVDFAEFASEKCDLLAVSLKLQTTENVLKRSYHFQQLTQQHQQPQPFAQKRRKLNECSFQLQNNSPQQSIQQQQSKHVIDMQEKLRPQNSTVSLPTCHVPPHFGLRSCRNSKTLQDKLLQNSKSCSNLSQPDKTLQLADSANTMSFLDKSPGFHLTSQNKIINDSKCVDEVSDKATTDLSNACLVPGNMTNTVHDSSTVTNHPDAPENVNQEFSILNIIPSLISEKHRKAAFVENLVDTAGLILEVIWANFSISPNAKIITLRVFLQETLRRSRTSYSTLQTALFYLFRIKHKIAFLSQRSELPPTPTSEHPPDVIQNSCQNNDPATCGRRMFLAALIVASKYLQDRNYSNRAWSKISGLTVKEINANEVCFLKLIDYNLFIAEDIFKRWSTLLLTHIQAISGPDISNPEAFRNAENQSEVSRFRETLRLMDPKTMECKRPPGFGIYPITPAVSAPGSPCE
ncbi:cyclin-domain-containing protein [Gigaspora rosea]|uniref:Cyclin-domain-containing protein n=1 Tax=Gigaspora rosea TaxID=44941 RepID=A0A397U5X2_9GLOM|nr:cyclin-domain-containing protein [Gigaspora rosea]